MTPFLDRQGLYDDIGFTDDQLLKMCKTEGSINLPQQPTFPTMKSSFLGTVLSMISANTSPTSFSLR